jgi:hypothetical protein
LVGEDLELGQDNLDRSIGVGERQDDKMISVGGGGRCLLVAGGAPVEERKHTCREGKAWAARRDPSRGEGGRAIDREGKAWAARRDPSRGEGGRPIGREGKVKADRSRSKFCDMWTTKSNLPSPNRVVLEKPLFLTWHLSFALGKIQDLPSEG